MSEPFDLVCPAPAAGQGERILLAHGEGGRLSRRLVEQRILPRLNNAALAPLGDAALLSPAAGRLAFSSDSFVVSPLFFPGGDIGRLSVFGTANDLAVAGARPRWLCLSLILEEGLPLETLEQVLDSVAAAAREAEVLVVTGDTKVVPRGAADDLFLNTAGIGELIEPVPPGPASLELGDELLVSGPLGRHAMAVLAAREGLGFEPPPKSDCAPLFPAVEALRRAGVPVRAMRDATRGGLAAVLHEWAAASGRTLLVDEARLPADAAVRGASELLGLDPLHAAGEGVFAVVVPSGWGAAAAEALRSVPVAAQAAIVGSVLARGPAPAVVQRALGRVQPLDDPLGAPLPRIC